MVISAAQELTGATRIEGEGGGAVALSLEGPSPPEEVPGRTLPEEAAPARRAVDVLR